MAIGVNQGSTTRVLAGRVLTHPVDTGHIALVLEGAGTKQGTPDLYTGCRPAGHVYDHIIILAVTRPYRETQVITNLQQDTYPLIGDDDPFLPCRKRLVLASIGEQMVFVVGTIRSVRIDEIKAVVELSVFFDGDTSSQRTSPCTGYPLHPRQRTFTDILFGNPLRVCAKSGREHFREYI